MRSNEYRREKEEAVYAAVLRLIESGSDLSRVTVQQIAEAAGIGKGTVYEYFSSKEEILRQASLHCLTCELDRLDKAMEPCRTLTDMENSLLAYLRELCAARAASYRILARSLSNGKSAEPSPAGCCPVQPLRDRLYGSMGRVIGRLQQAGEIDPALGLDFCAHVFLSAAGLYAVGLVDMQAVHVPAHPALQALARNTCLLIDRALRPR